MHQDDTPFCWLGGRKRSVSAPPRRPQRPAPTASSTSSGPSTSSAAASSAADYDLAAVVALVRAAGAALEQLDGELRCTFDDLFCTVSSADKHLTRTDVRAAVAYLRTEYEIVVDRDSGTLGGTSTSLSFWRIRCTRNGGRVSVNPCN